MKKLIVRITRFCLIRLIGKQNIESIILLMSRLTSTDLLMLAYQNIGILKFKDNFVSGEYFVITSVLKKYLKKETPIFFDVGANVGDYSKELRREFPDSKIYAFEPNIDTFEIMSKNLAAFNINCFNLGLGSKIAIEKIYTYKNGSCWVEVWDC